jgi:hypothetical protein
VTTQVTAPQAQVRVGVARVDITPPVGIYHRLWGAARHDRATGVHRPLTATALALQSADGAAGPAHEQVLLALDLCLLWWREQQQVLDAIRRRTGLGEELFCTYSHTHASSLPGLERVGLPGGDLIPGYLEDLASRLADAVLAARESVRPATMVFGEGVCSLAAHRDFWDAESGQYVCGFNPEGPVDPTVLVARAVAADGRPLATLVNYACHPTTLAWDNTLISPDFPGAMAEVIEQATGVPCLFLQGASGDIGPREGFVGDPAVADRNGRQLGYAALAVLEGLPSPGTAFTYTGPVISGATIGTWAARPIEPAVRERQARWRLRRSTLPLPYRPDLPTLAQTVAERERWLADERVAEQTGDAARARDCHAMVERMTRILTRIESLPSGEAFPLPMVLWQTGDAFWVAVEAEHYNYLQRELRERFPGTPIMVITLMNGSRATYLPTADSYGKGIYQETIAVLAQGCLEQVTEAIARQIGEWKNS